MSEYLKRMKYFDYFLEHLIEGRACTEGPRGLKYYDMLYRVSGDIADAYSIFQPYLSITPYIYIYYASVELEKQEPPRRGAGDVVRDIIRRIAVR